MKQDRFYDLFILKKDKGKGKGKGKGEGEGEGKEKEKEKGKGKGKGWILQESLQFSPVGFLPPIKTVRDGLGGTKDGSKEKGKSDSLWKIFFFFAMFIFEHYKQINII